jgi:hypothetical protein
MKDDPEALAKIELQLKTKYAELGSSLNDNVRLKNAFQKLRAQLNDLVAQYPQGAFVRLSVKTMLFLFVFDCFKRFYFFSIFYFSLNQILINFNSSCMTMTDKIAERWSFTFTENKRIAIERIE